MGTGFNVGNFCGASPLEIRSDNLGGRRGGSRGRCDSVGGRCGGSRARGDRLGSQRGGSRGRGDSVGGRCGGNGLVPFSVDL